MSVTGFMYNINATKKLGELELNEGLDGNRSWHHQFKDSAYVYVGGLHQGLTEGDIVLVFSQFGEVIDVNMVRDKQTGKSKGFAFICYEDQRSTVLAVDNMNGFQLLKRTLRVDHVGKYKAPKEFDENDKDADGDPKLLEYKATGAEGAGHQVYNVTKGQQKLDEIVKGRKAPGKTSVEDQDEAWAKAFEASLAEGGGGGGGGKKKKGKKGKKGLKSDKKDLKQMKEEAKRLKEETKKVKKETKRLKKARRGGGRGAAKAEPSSSSGSRPSSSSSGDSSLSSSSSSSS